MNVGDVHWVEFPPRNGHVQAGRRPAIVAQDASAIDRLPTTLVIPLTTQLGALRFPGTVLVDPEAGNGLGRPSVALVFQLTVLDRRYLSARMGQVSESVVKALWSALDEIPGELRNDDATRASARALVTVAPVLPITAVKFAPRLPHSLPSSSRPTAVCGIVGP